MSVCPYTGIQKSEVPNPKPILLHAERQRGVSLRTKCALLFCPMGRTAQTVSKLVNPDGLSRGTPSAPHYKPLIKWVLWATAWSPLHASFRIKPGFDTA